MNLPEELKGLVVSVGDTLKEGQLDSIIKLWESSDRSFKLQTIVTTWEKQQTSERKMRFHFGWAVMITLIIQITILNVCFFLLGFGLFTTDEWVAKTFLISSFTEVTVIAGIIIRYLFPTVTGSITDLIEKL